MACFQRVWGCTYYCEAVTDHIVEGYYDSQIGPSFEAVRDPLKTFELKLRGGTVKNKSFGEEKSKSL